MGLDGKSYTQSHELIKSSESLLKKKKNREENKNKLSFQKKLKRSLSNETSGVSLNPHFCQNIQAQIWDLYLTSPHMLHFPFKLLLWLMESVVG